MSYISTNLNMLTTVAKKVSGGLSRDFNELEKLQTSVKGHAEFTKAAIERTLKILRTELQKARPQHAVISKGDKVAQLIVIPIATPDFIEVESLEETERGDGAFGSTGDRL